MKRGKARKLIKKAIIASVAKGDYDGQTWRTINGTNVQFGEGGEIVSGPEGLKSWAKGGDATGSGKTDAGNSTKPNRTRWVKDNGTTMEQDIKSGKYANEHEARLAYIRENASSFVTDEDCVKIEESMSTWLSDNWRDADGAPLDLYTTFAEPYEGDIYRGMWFRPEDGSYDKFMKQCREGGEISSTKNMSWSSMKGIAEEFSCMDDELDSIMIQCTKNLTSVPVNCLTTANEREVLSNSAARWEIKKITESKKEYGGRLAVIEVEEKEYDPDDL